MIDAEEVGCRLKLSSTANNIMQRDRQAQPQIMVQRRPIRSRAKAGSRLPIGNMSWMKPAMRSAVDGSRPTFLVKAVGR